MKKTFLLLFLVFTLAVVVSGCGKNLKQNAVEKYVESQSGAEVDLRDDGMTIKDKDGNVISTKSGKTLPSGWPQEVPYYKKGTIEQATFMALPGGKTFTIIIMTNDDREDVIDFYKEEFAKGGFEATLEMDTGESYILGGEKDDLSVSVNVSEEDGKQAVSQVVTQAIE